VTVTYGSFVQNAAIRVDAKGQPAWVMHAPMDECEPRKKRGACNHSVARSDLRMASGYRIPFRVDGGNFFGTPQKFSFCRAQVVEARFL
jgi:hypothetical protein